MNFSRLLLAAALACTCATAIILSLNPAFAQVATPAAAGTAVTIPVADWLQAVQPWVTEILLALALFLVRKLPPQVVSILTSMRVDQILGKAIAYGFNTVEGAAAGQPLTLDVANKVVAQALQYFIDHAPEWIVRWSGDVELIKQKIIARLTVAPDVAVGN